MEQKQQPKKHITNNMSQLEFDLNYVKSILDYDNDDTFGFIYSRTTEDLNCIFDNLNYQNKKS